MLENGEKNIWAFGRRKIWNFEMEKSVKTQNTENKLLNNEEYSNK